MTYFRCGAMVFRISVMALLSMVLGALWGCDSEDIEQSSGILLDHSDWRLATEEEDPWSERLPGRLALLCEGSAAGGVVNALVLR